MARVICLSHERRPCHCVVIVLYCRLDPEKREKKIAKTTAQLHKVFAKTKFKEPEIIAVSARPGGAVSAATDEVSSPPFCLRSRRSLSIDVLAMRRQFRFGITLALVAHSLLSLSVAHCFLVLSL
jgi:hypothetical protein